MRQLATAFAALALAAGTAQAGFFQAAHLLYVPVAAHNEGSEGSVWRTDLYITNVDTAPVDVALFFLPSGGGDNSFFMETRQYGVGGREGEAWGHVEPRLADIPPGGTVALEDVVGAYWLEDFARSASLGAIVIFAYEAGTADDPVYRNVVAQSRTYNETTVWVPDPESADPDNPTFIEKPATYGQTVPAVPWYSMADASAISEQGDFSYLILVGGREDADFRYNVGFVNASDKQTGITLRLTPLDEQGAPYLDENDQPIERFVRLGALGHFQSNRVLSSLFGLSDVTVARIKVALDSWDTTSPDPVVMFTCYGSLVDGRGNDPTTILPSFGFPFNVQCMFPTPTDGGAAGAAARPVREPAGRRPPLELPGR